MVLVRCILFVGMLLGAAPAFAMGNMPASTDSGPLVGRQAVDFTLDMTRSSRVNFTKFRDGKKAVIFFWATWCPHCHEEIMNLNAHLDKLNEQGIKVALVDLGESLDEVKYYLDRQGSKLDSFVDMDSSLSDAYDLIGVPTLYFVDEQGIIRDMQHVFPSNYEASFKQQ